MLLRLLGNLVRVLFAPIHALRRALAVPRGAFVHVVLDGAIVDIAPELRFWEKWREPKRVSLHALGKLLDDVAKDARVRGVLVTIRSIRGGMASATSLRAVLAKVKDAKRELVVHLPLGALTKELFVASIADRVYVGPRAHVAPLGFAASTRYVKRALDRAGVEPEVYAQGRFKSAGEQLVRDGMSDAQKEQVGALLDAFHAELVSALASGRGLSREEATRAIDEAPYDVDEAVAAKLVDGGAYEDELPDVLGRGGEKARIVDAGRYAHVTRAAKWRPIRRGRAIGP